MKYRGLSPVAQIVLWVGVAIGIGVVLAVSLPMAVGGLTAAVLETPSKLPWFATRVTAFLSYLAIAGSVVYGLLLSTKILDAIAHRPVTYALHQDLAAVGLGLAGIHGVLLGLDSTVPFSFAEMLIPFAAPYRPIWVGIGQLAFYVTAAVIASFYARRHIGQRAWRLLHYTTFLAFVGATAHGILAGTDTATPWAFWIYVTATVWVVFLTTYRVVLSVAASRERRAAADRRGGVGIGIGEAVSPLAYRRPA
jgi:predicted ferric reductase